MKFKSIATWVAVLVLGSVAWVALGAGHSPFEFVGMMAGVVCAFFIVDFIETASGRRVNIYRFGLVALAVVAILRLVHVPEIAGIPIALILTWKFEDFLL